MRDALIVCGDVSASLVILEETLTTLKSAFAEVFYVTGNHDLWTKGRGLAGGLHIRKKDVDSLEKLSEIHGLCKRLGVRTEPGYAYGRSWLRSIRGIIRGLTRSRSLMVGTAYRPSSR